MGRTGLGCLTAVTLRIALLGCLLVSATTVIGAWRHLWFRLSGVTVEALVVRQAEELVADWNEPGAARPPAGAAVQMAPARRLYRTIVEFKEDGQSYLIQAQTLSASHLYPLRSHVDVVYAPGRPASARLRPELPDFWLQAGYLLLGTILGAAAVYWWWKLLVRRGRINPLSDGRSNVSGG
ncbi:MAG: hypothetical protein WCP29_06465 [Acidobacteriota bacterium]